MKLARLSILMAASAIGVFYVAAPAAADGSVGIADEELNEHGGFRLEVIGRDDGDADEDETFDDSGSTFDQVADTVTDEIDMGEDRPRWVAVPAPGTTGDEDDGNSGWCRDVDYIEVTDLTGEEEAQLIDDYNASFGRAAEQAAMYRDDGVPDQNVLCPIEEMDGIDPMFIEVYVREAIVEHAPRPQPHIPPGHALTGMPAYLVTDHELSMGPIEIDMDLGFTSVQGVVEGAAYTAVDWGDGTHTEHHTPGLPYPNGEVEHVYTDKGEVDIQIVDQWRVSYEAADGAITGTVIETLEPATIEGFEVREYRAVRLNTEQGG